jgi:hypothetical protein
MYCDVWRDKNLCETNLCDRRLTRIIRINKTRAEKCTFTVLSITSHVPRPIPMLISMQYWKCSDRPGHETNPSYIHDIV